MKKKIVPMMTASVLMIMTAFPVYAQETDVFAGGNGTPSDPWQIETAQQLLAVNDDLTANYVLISDIDLSSYENWPMIGTYVMDENSEEGEDPVSEYAFSGTLDGQGHTITNLKMDYTEDYEHMIGVGLFSCITRGGVLKNLTIQNAEVSGMMIVGTAVGYAFECTVENVDLTAEERNSVTSTLMMAGGVIGGLTCSSFTDCDVENTDIISGSGGNSGALGGGMSKPVLENDTVRNCTVSALLGPVEMFGMPSGNWIGGLTGCVNLDDYDAETYYVKNCGVYDTQITVSGDGIMVGGLIGSCGRETNENDQARLVIDDCTVSNTLLTIGDSITDVGGLTGGSFYEDPSVKKSFEASNCMLSNVSIITDAKDLKESSIGLAVGFAQNSQIKDCNVDVQIKSADGTLRDAEVIGVKG